MCQKEEKRALCANVKIIIILYNIINIISRAHCANVTSSSLSSTQRAMAGLAPRRWGGGFLGNHDKYHQGDNHKDTLDRDCEHLIFIVEGIGPLHCIVVDYQTLPFARTQTWSYLSVKRVRGLDEDVFIFFLRLTFTRDLPSLLLATCYSGTLYIVNGIFVIFTPFHGLK